MRTMTNAATRFASGLAASILLLSGGNAPAQTVAPAATVALTAAPTSTTLPDGQTVPMWGYTCGAAAVASCLPLNPAAALAGSWSPVVITVPYTASAGKSTTSLSITLTNNLLFSSTTGGTVGKPIAIPTSLMIVGQVGGGLGGGGTTAASPQHPPQQVTWPVAATGPTNTPVAQLPRVQSFGTEVVNGTPQTLTWSNLRPGTYLIESGTHPSIQAPMGLYGILVVTTPAASATAPAYTYKNCTTPGATPGCDNYDANVPLLLSEIDPVQNAAVAAAVLNANFSETRAWSGQPIVPAPTATNAGNTTAGCGYPGTPSSPNPLYQSCYPPTVNYSPRYYLVNGTSFDRTNLASATTSVLASAPAPVAGKLMLNLVNAGSHMHVPSVVGLPLTLVAEDGNPLPGLPRIQNEVFLSAGKTYDVLVTPGTGAATPPATGNVYSPATYPIFDRALSLSTDNARDGGMQAYIAVAGGATTGVGSSASGIALSLPGGSSFAPTYYCTTGTTLAVTDPSKGVLGGSTGANGAAVVAQKLPGTLVFQSNGTFIYNPPPTGACGGSFTFTVNSAATQYVATINECDVNGSGGGCKLGGAPTANSDIFTASNASQLQIGSPGLLMNDSDPSGLPLQVDLTTVSTASPAAGTPSGAVPTIKANPDGSFQALLGTACTAAPTAQTNALGIKTYSPGFCSYTFTYNIKNQQGKAAANTATVTLNFPGRSGLQLTLLDDKNPTWAPISDYRWVIEEDDTMWTDPKCQVATAAGAARPIDSYGHACPPMPVESIGYNFHTANMKVIATGCVGSVSCESGQTVWNGTGHISTACDIGNGVCRTDGTSQRQPLSPGDVYLDPMKHYFISVLPGDGINPTIFPASSPQTIAANCKTDGQTLAGPFYGIAGGAAGGGPVTTAVTCSSSTTGGFTVTPTATRPFSPTLDCTLASDYTPGVGKCGHNLSGRQIPPQFNPQGTKITPAVTISMAQTPLPTAKIAVFIYEDDYPLNGENDAGGGVDILAPNEKGLGSFQVELLDQGGQFGDNNGQPTYDMFNMPLTNSLNGTLDPSTGLNACPISSNPDGIVGMIVTCPEYESDGITPSPLQGQAVIENLYPGLYEVSAVASADRIARGEQWIQTNTLDGGKPHEAFIRPGEPSYFQEFGPGGFHIQMGFANPKIINNRRSNSAKTGLCDPAPLGGGLACNSSMSGQVHGDHMARTPDERTYDTGSYDAMKFSNCYVALSIPDAQTFAFANCDASGNFSFQNLPDGVYQMAVFDQWNDIMLDGLVAAVTVSGNTVVQPTVIQWRTNVYTRTYLDVGSSVNGVVQGAGNGIPDRDSAGNDLEPGLPFVPIHLRYRDGSIGFKMSTDLNGYASNNEVFPFMNWMVMEPDTTRYKPTGVHVIYDAGGPDDCSAAATAAYGANAKCSTAASHLAATIELNSLPTSLRIPGAVYCSDADCVLPADSILNGTYYLNGGTLAGNSGAPPTSGTSYLSSGRIDPPWAIMEGFQGLLGQHHFFDYGFKPFKAATATTPAENGGIFGHVAYASTRPFDDPTLLVQNPWEPLVPNVQINLYQVSTNPDGFTTLTLVDTTKTTSWDAYAQGFRTDGSGTGTFVQNTDGTTNPVTGGSNNGYITNMNCPGNDSTSPFFQTLQGSKMWLDSADPVSGQKKTIAYNAQFKCFDGWSVMNQIQPAPYDGRYQFPSVVDRNPVTGRPSGTGSLNGAATPVAGTNCTICIANPDDGNPMLPAGTYVVEVVTPAGWEIVKEEDKNILVGDQFIAPVTQQFAGLGNVFILPDQAAMNAYYNFNNAQNPTTNLGVINLPRSDFNNTTDQVWPCVGAMRTVPDYLSLFPSDKQVSPFAGASRPLCDRKEVVLSDQMAANTQFFIYTKTHVAGHFTGMMTNDMASEFDPFSPQFGEKFGAANLPVNMRDFMGTEMSRVYGDQWGVYNGLYMSTWEVNPPNPTGYAPQMSIACMNDPGPILDTDPNSPTTGQMIVDPAYNPAYSNFCYEQMFMPGMTNYMDTPVTPVMAFADHYNLPDAELPNNTPVIKRADFTGNGLSGTIAGGTGPWAPDFTKPLVLQSVGDLSVNNPNFTGPSGLTAPYNLKKIVRHYGFGSQCSAVGGSCAAISSVTVGGQPATITAWSDAAITVTVPNSVPMCPMQQIGYTGQHCGEVVITAGNGLQSVTGISVTIGGKTPTLVTTSSPSSNGFGEFYPNPVQYALDNATPGDLIILDAGVYRENLIMWKPLRLQGVGAYAVTINADAQPAGKMDAWRRRIDCIFGLQLNGWTNANNAQFGADGESFTCPNNMYFRADRLPFEGFVGWDASSNGNLAQVLQEPALMGAYEGAGLTVVGRGVWQPNASDLWGMGGGAGTYIDGSFYLNDPQVANLKLCATATTSLPATYSGAGDFGTGNFNCNPSGLDGVTVTNSSQGGGGVYLHGWNNNFEIANNRIVANAGTLAGGINVGNGEAPPVAVNDNQLCGNTGVTPNPICPPIPPGTALNGAIPTQLQTNVHIHHNQVIDNASIGDALFSGSPAGAGGITVSAGSDEYEIDHNWIAGNLTSSDGGGLAHMGLSFNGYIHNNWVLFNEANNPTLPVDGGGVIIMGAQEDRTLLATQQECGGTTDTDCPPGIGDGTGPGLVIDSNLILGNSAAYGSGGGLRLRQTNGTEVSLFPNQPSQWYGITVTNNIIVNNVAGWDGGGVSLQDSLKTVIANNTIASNDTTASAGVLFKTLGAIDAASPPPGCLPTPDPSQPQSAGCLNPNAPHIPQPAGLVTMQNTPNMQAQLVGYVNAELGAIVNTGPITCPAGFGYGNSAGSVTGGITNATLTVTATAPGTPASLPVGTIVYWGNAAGYNTAGSLQTAGLQQSSATITAVLAGGRYTISPAPAAAVAAGTTIYTEGATESNLTNGRCILVSLPKLVNNIFWQNRAFHVEMTDSTGQHIVDQGQTVPNGTGLASQQNIITLFPTFTQATTGQCLPVTQSSDIFSQGTELYWDVGVRMDTLPNVNGHALVFNTSTVGASFNLEGAVSTTIGTVVSGLTVTNGGTGYAVGEPIVFPAQTAPQTAAAAVVTSVSNAGAITAVNLTSGGSYTTAPVASSLTVSGLTFTGYVGANNGRGAANTTLTVTTAGIALRVGQTITGAGLGAGTTINAVLGGGRYTISKSLRITSEAMTAPAGTGAAFAIATATGVTAATVTDTGGAYTSAPTAVITGCGGTGAAITLKVQNGLLSGAVVTSGGTGYTCAPTVTLTGGGLVPNSAENAPIGLSASNSIFSDAINAANVFGINNVVPTDPNGAGGAGTLVNQYCNGARVPPEQCSQAQGANNQGMCLGYFTPAGISENVGVPQVFRFANIAATATVDEGNNWINMTYGPLTLSRVAGNTTGAYVNATLSPMEQIVTVPAVGTKSGAYSLPTGSAAIGTGATLAGLTTDFYGNPRSAPYDIGAVAAYKPKADLAITMAVNLATDSNGDVSKAAYQGLSYTIVVSNAGPNDAIGATVSDPAPANLTLGGWTCASTSGSASCPATGSGALNAVAVNLPAGSSVTFVLGATVSSTDLGGVITNTATVAAPAGLSDPNPANNSASASTTLNPPSLKSVTPSSGVLGRTYLGIGTLINPTFSGADLAGVISTTWTDPAGAVDTNIMCLSFTQVNASTVSAQCLIVDTQFGAATPGSWTVAVTTPNGTSNALPFLVTVPVLPPLTLGAPTTAGPPQIIGGGNTTFTLTNNSATSVTIGTPSVVKTNKGAGTISIPATKAAGACGVNTQLAPGGTCTIVVNLTGASLFNPVTATLSVTGGVSPATTGITASQYLEGF